MASRPAALAVVTSMLLTLAAAAEPAAVILQRSHALALGDLGPRAHAEARAWIGALPADGWWPDVPPQHGGRAGWRPADHIARLQTIAVLSGPGGALAGDAAADAAVLRAIDAWERLRPRSDNWWHNEIGVPLMATQILASRRDLDAGRQAALHGWIGRPLDDGEYASTFTGQNLAWRARIALLAAAARGDAHGIDRAVAASTSTIAVGDAEGLQADASWHQHGAQFMTGSYGRSWVADMGRLQLVLDGTPWAFTPVQRDLFDRAALDGLAWTLRGGIVDPAALGRTLSRRASHGGQHGLGRLAHLLADLGGPRAAEWRALAASCQDGRSAVTGARHFWRSDASFLHRPGFSVGILAATTRTLRVESINEEHLLGGLHADGSTWIRRQGDEYAHLTPVLPWDLLPGTVAADGTDVRPQGLRVPAESAYGAGVVDGALLVHGWDLARGPLRGQQAWFGVEQGLIVLVCGVSHPTARVRMAGPMLPLRGPVTRAAQPITGTTMLATGQVLIHDGLAWMAVAGQWQADQPTLHGSWQRINAAQDAAAQALPVLHLHRDLGTAPQDGAGGWALLDLPDGGAPQPRFQVLANTPIVQAVQDGDGSVLAAFRAAGSAGALSVDGPAVVLARPDGRVQVADPAAPSRPRRLGLRWQGRDLAIDLPGGPHGAQPIAVHQTP